LCLFPLSAVPLLDLLDEDCTGSPARSTIHIVVRYQADGMGAQCPSKDISAGQSADQRLRISPAAEAKNDDVGLDQRRIELYLRKFA
jgi:hypothetical protein